jgi:NOL1/NOP2/fmu family ribosome biogenesis protein
MINLQFINSKELKIFLIRLEEQFGLSDTKFLKKYVFLKNVKKKVFITTKSEKDTKLRIPRAEKAGIYFGRINKDDSIRLSLEGTQLIGGLATKNIFELDHNQAENWLKGFDFEIPKLDDGYYLLRYKEDFLGCGLIRSNKLHNFLPKTRRLKVLYD